MWETIGIPEEGGVAGSASPSMDDNIIVAPGAKDNFSVLNIDDGSFLWGDSLLSMSFETVVEEVQELSEFLTEEELYEFSLIKETVGIPESLNEFSLMNRFKMMN